MHKRSSARSQGPSIAPWMQRAVVAFTLASALLLCGFMKPRLANTIYDGTRYSTFIHAYQHAYAAVGMTDVKIVTEDEHREPDGTVSATRTFTFSCPSSAHSRGASCSATFSVSTHVKHGICRDCRVTRKDCSGDPAADRRASDEIHKVLGKSPPALSGG